MDDPTYFFDSKSDDFNKKTDPTYFFDKRYNGTLGADIVGYDPAERFGTDATTFGNSGNLDEIRRQLYHYNGTKQWSNDIWVVNGTNSLPILRFQPPPSPSPKPSQAPTSSTFASASPKGMKDSDLRHGIKEGKDPCFYYISEKNLFQMNCSVLEWQRQGYGNRTHISLRAYEELDGGGGVIDLSSIDGFEGLIRIDMDEGSFQKAPLVRNIHVKYGTTAQSLAHISHPRSLLPLGSPSLTLLMLEHRSIRVS